MTRHLTSRLPAATALALFVLVSAVANGAFAATNAWSFIGPAGGDVQQLEIDRADASRMIAVAGEGVIVSSDGGSTWSDTYFQGRRLLSGVVSTALPAIVAAGPSRFYAVTATNNVVVSSTDGGRTWSGFAFDGTIVQLEADVGDGSTIYARVVAPNDALGAAHMLMRSTDGGASWTRLQVPASGSVYDVVTDPVRAGIVYAGVRSPTQPVETTYYRSVDRGVTFTALQPALPGGAFSSLAIDRANPDALYVTRLADGRTTLYLARSLDGGVTWQVGPTTLPAGTNDRYDLVPDPFIRGTLYVGSTSAFQMYRSTDDGITWTKVPLTVPRLSRRLDLVAHPTRPGRLFGLSGGLYVTDDTLRWSEITAGFSSQRISLLEVDEPRVIVARVLSPESMQFDQTTDLRHWTTIAAPPTPIAGGATAIASPPWSPRRYAIGRIGGPNGESLLYASIDDGATWMTRTVSGDVPHLLYAVSDATTPKGPQLMAGPYAFFPCSNNNCLAAIYLSLSRDGGSTWQRVASLPAGDIVSVAIPPVGMTTQVPVIVVALSTGIARSTDGGMTFRMIATAPRHASLTADPHRSPVLYASTQPDAPKLFRSADGGSTWTELAFDAPLDRNTGTITSIGFTETRSDRVDIAAANGRLMRSADAGATFRTLSNGPGEPAGFPLGGTFTVFGRQEPRTAYFVSRSHGLGTYTIDRDRPVEVIEFHNTILDHYFLTPGAEEAQGIERGAAGPGWNRTGVAFRAWLASDVAPADARPVCRFYGTPGIGPNSHFYTIDPRECVAVRQDPGWTIESADVFYLLPATNGACPAGRTPIRRAYNNRFAHNDSNHRYATDRALYDATVARGWLAEGVVMCSAE